MTKSITALSSVESRGDALGLLHPSNPVERRLEHLDGPDGIAWLEADLTLLDLGASRADASSSLARAASIATEHAFLRRLLETAEGLLDRIVERLSDGDTGGQRRAAACLLLEHLGRGLAIHFENEEQDGSLLQALERAPRFHRRASGLQGEHREFLARASALHRRSVHAGVDVFVWRCLHDELRALRASLADHERAENEIVQRAWNEDLGGGD